MCCAGKWAAAFLLATAAVGAGFVHFTSVEAAQPPDAKEARADLTALREAVATAGRRGENVDEIRKAFRKKRDLLMHGLRSLGVRFERESEGTFYLWGNLSNLPPPLDTGAGLFRAALEHKVIVVPGHFFDVDPGQRRVGRASRFLNYARFSFGPSEAVLETALARLSDIVTKAKGG